MHMIVYDLQDTVAKDDDDVMEYLYFDKLLVFEFSDYLCIWIHFYGILEVYEILDVSFEIIGMHIWYDNIFYHTIWTFDCFLFLINVLEWHQDLQLSLKLINLMVYVVIST